MYIVGAKDMLGGRRKEGRVEEGRERAKDGGRKEKREEFSLIFGFGMFYGRGNIRNNGKGLEMCP